MPSEMSQRGRRDAEAETLDESYYQYYYDYKLAYDEVVRNRRRSRRQRWLRRVGRILLIALPLLLVAGGAGYYAFQRYGPPTESAAPSTPTPTRTPRPTLVPPTPRPTITPTPELALRADAFAVVTGTQGLPLRVRSSPGANATLVTRLREGQTVRLLEGPQDADGITWWKIESDGQTGWASGQFLQPVRAPQ